MSKLLSLAASVGAGIVGLPAGGAEFVEVPSERSGVDFVHSFAEDEARAYLYYSGFGCGAVCIADVNGDQWPDLYFSDGAGENGLFLNRGALAFARSAQPALGGGGRWGTGAALVDLDADGDLDLCQANYDAPVQIFVNDGRGNFAEQADAFGLAVTDAALAVTFADVDNDGDLDAFVLCNEYTRPGGRPAEPPFEVRNGVPVVKEEFAKYYEIAPNAQGALTMDDYGRADYFFLNTGTRTKPRYRDQSVASGLNRTGHGLSCTWIDYDLDGDLDLYVANDFLTPDRLYRNEGVSEGIPRFVDVAAEVLPTMAWSSMGSDICDINNDGLPDLMVAEMSATTHFKAKLNMGEMAGERRWVLENGWPRQAMRNHLYVHNGSGIFSETAFASGVASSDWSWAPKLADFDNDGRVDLFITNGITRNFSDSDHHAKVGDMTAAQIGRTKWDLYKDLPPMKEKNRAYRNVDGMRFEDVSEEWGLDLEGLSYSAAYGDLDGDGDLDLVVSDLGNQVRIYENTVAGGNSFKVRLEGRSTNVMGIGTKVTVLDTEGRLHTRWMNPGTGFLSQNEPVLHFGLGKAQAKEVTAFWRLTRSTASVQRETPGSETTNLVLREPEDSPSVDDDGPKPWFRMGKSMEGVDFVHREARFDDFARQPLLPSRLSQLGAAVAAADVDGDGDLDLFAGGAAGQSSELFVNDGGVFAKLKGSLFSADLGRECLDALWFDADGDQDPDLYVANGSVEYGPGDARYGDRLYLNRSQPGRVVLTLAEAALPALADSGSCVAAGDYDGDGDLDLFVGSRSEVGSYPVSPKSRLLRNESSAERVKFVEATEEAAPGLLGAGLVTGAEWSDVDRDGDADLLVAVEWGPVRLFLNEGGKLAEKTAEAGLAERSGWWSAVRTADLDGDGDADYLLGNVGWNTKYGRASSKKPALLYHGEMDGSGERHLVEAKTAEDRLLPVRGKSCSTHAIPSLGRKFGTYRDFAVCDLVGLYTDERLAKAAKFEATCFESGVLLNETPKGGAPAFRWVEMPWEAQLSPLNDFAVADLDGEAGDEIVGAQNHFTREPETGLWRGNPGVVLRWRDGRFESVPPRRSGLVLSGDTKSVLAADLDGDGDVDIAVGQNDGPLLTIQNLAR